MQHICNIAWAYASLMQLRGPFADALLFEIRARLAATEFNSQQLSNLLWSLALAEVLIDALTFVFMNHR